MQGSTQNQAGSMKTGGKSSNSKLVTVVLALIVALLIVGYATYQWVLPSFGYFQPKELYGIYYEGSGNFNQQDFPDQLNINGHPFTGTLYRLQNDFPDWFEQEEPMGELVYKFRYENGLRNGECGIYKKIPVKSKSNPKKYKVGAGMVTSERICSHENRRYGILNYSEGVLNGVSVELRENGDTIQANEFDGVNYASNEGSDVNQASNANLPEYLNGNQFALNGGGTVYFDFVGGFNTGNIRVTGGRAELLGTFTVLSSRKLKISNLKAVNGEFDASNNSGSNGIFKLYGNGNIGGTLFGRGGSRSVILSPR